MEDEMKDVEASSDDREKDDNTTIVMKLVKSLKV